MAPLRIPIRSGGLASGRRRLFSFAVRPLMGALSFVFFACGIEDYIYLPPVPESAVTQEPAMSGAIIRLPQIDVIQFRNFAIFYRIYISGTLLASATPSEYSTLNAALSSDYNIFLPYTNVATNTSVNASAVGTLFKNRNYWKLEIQDAGIDSFLGSGGQTITIDFQSIIGRAPTLNRGGAEYVLNRSNGDGTFNPVPHRRFLNTAELNLTDNATTLINADVAPVSGSSSGDYAYVAMYIVAMGIDNNFSPIYSSPAFLGVFRLPD
ncbi:MAG: hypothetical protein LBL45_04195 [Treponema sp.]|nr:hypothetical protein [Treponema sp.]